MWGGCSSPPCSVLRRHAARSPAATATFLHTRSPRTLLPRSRHVRHRPQRHVAAHAARKLHLRRVNVERRRDEHRLVALVQQRLHRRKERLRRANAHRHLRLPVDGPPQQRRVPARVGAGREDDAQRSGPRSSVAAARAAAHARPTHRFANACTSGWCPAERQYWFWPSSWLAFSASLTKSGVAQSGKPCGGVKKVSLVRPTATPTRHCAPHDTHLPQVHGVALARERRELLPHRLRAKGIQTPSQRHGRRRPRCSGGSGRHCAQRGRVRRFTTPSCATKLR